ncbi:hypothetical protein BJ165DRAFT_636040 [Panaeolus papilionaceus]|nr:hypothetical protein BJ165DRAFT_636040 [Panaeolus papilionaceus]
MLYCDHFIIRWHYPEVENKEWWKGPRDRAIFTNILQRIDIPPDIWIYLLDCEKTLQDDFRTHIQKSFDIDDDYYYLHRKNPFRRLYNSPRPQDSGIVSPLELALAECTWNVDCFLHGSEHYHFLRNHRYDQILIPGIPELAVYMATYQVSEYCSGPGIPVKAVLCSCGWADFIPLVTDS